MNENTTNENVAPESDQLTQPEIQFLENKLAIHEGIAEQHNQAHLSLSSALHQVIEGMTKLAERLTALEQEHVTMARVAHIHDGQQITRPKLKVGIN